jgi:hypothetical protein
VTPSAETQVYLVLRTHFEELGSSLRAAAHAADEGEPVRAFADRGRAEDWRAELEELERRKTGPFWFARATDETNADLAARAEHRGLRPPRAIDPHGYDPDEWSWWWQRVALSEPAEQVGGLWEDFGGGRFYETATVTLDGTPRPVGSLFVVRRLAWYRWTVMTPGRTEEVGFLLGRDHSGRTAFGRPVRAFADRHEADAFRTQAERRDRAGENPFDYRPSDDDSISGRTSLDYPLLHDWLLDCGAVRVPDTSASESGWRAWWARTVPKLSPLQQAKAWEAFDRVRLYDVVEVDWDAGPF